MECLDLTPGKRQVARALFSVPGGPARRIALPANFPDFILSLTMPKA
jgi:hypothetical protein